MAVVRVALNATDPSVDGTLLAWHQPGGLGVLVNGGRETRLPGAHPAVGGGRLAVLRDNQVVVSQTSGPAFAAAIPAPAADACAVSAAWVAWRAREDDRDAIYAAALDGGRARRVMRAAELGRPALDRGFLTFQVAGRSGGRIVVADLAAGMTRTVRRERRAQLLNPSMLAGLLVYVRASYQRQELRIGPPSGRSPRRDELLWSTLPTGRRDAGREPGLRRHRVRRSRKLWPRPPVGVAATLWTTALAADAAYVTRLSQITDHPVVTEILRVPR
jgi:hypothetical protein